METVTLAALDSAECDIAYRRLDALMSSHGIKHAAIRSQHAQRILRESVETDLYHKGDTLETIAVERLQKEIDLGLNKILLSLDADETQLMDRQLLLLAMKNRALAQNYPDVVLGHAELPFHETEKLKALFRMQSTPIIKRSSMGAPIIRFHAIEEVTEKSIVLFSYIPFLKILVSAAGIAGLLGIVYLFAN